LDFGSRRHGALLKKLHWIAGIGRILQRIKNAKQNNRGQIPIIY